MSTETRPSVIETVDTETVKIGDTYVNKDAITPGLYFDYVKGLKQKINNEESTVYIY